MILCCMKLCVLLNMFKSNLYIFSSECILLMYYLLTYKVACNTMYCSSMIGHKDVHKDAITE